MQLIELMAVLRGLRDPESPHGNANENHYLKFVILMISVQRLLAITFELSIGVVDLTNQRKRFK